MTTTTSPRRGWRGAGAIFAGILAVFILSLGTDLILHRSGVYPPWGVRMSDALFGLAIAYRIPYGIAGGYVTARLAPDRPMRYALIMGGIGFALSLAGVAANLSKPGMGPLWYPLALVATALPCAWAGAKLHGGKSHD